MSIIDHYGPFRSLAGKSLQGARKFVVLLAFSLAALSACGEQSSGPELPAAEEAQRPGDGANVDGEINAENWPLLEPPIARNEAIENRITELLARMTAEEKVGQVLMADITTITPEEVGRYDIGSVLAGGSSAPDGDLCVPRRKFGSI